MKSVNDHILGLVVAALLATLPAAAQTELHHLVASDAQAEDHFGTVAVQGDLALVGAIEASAAYLFDLTTGAELRILKPSSGQPDDHFGASVALGGGLAVVGAPHDDDLGLGAGAFYVFDVATGRELRKVTPADGAQGDSFGAPLQVSGDRVLVGSDNDDDLGDSSGSAYLFDIQTGAQLRKLTASDGAEDDCFGTAVDLHGDRAVVGTQSSPGKAYVFDLTTGQELFQWMNGGRFGVEVAIGPSLVLVGAPDAAGADGFSGTVYMFDANTGQGLGELRPSGLADGDRYGSALSMDGVLAAVGAPADDDLGPSSGSVVVFELLLGGPLFKATASDGGPDDWFGDFAALDGDRLIVGALRDDGVAKNTGSAYVFSTSGFGDAYCPAVVNSSGLPARIGAYASVDADDGEPLLLLARQLPIEKFGYFLTSQTQDFVANPGGSQGNLCLGGTIVRFAKHVRKSGEEGAFRLLLKPELVPILTGETWNFQAWFRDKNPGPTSNFTDATSVLFL